jgi:pyruvate formate lyase activating enzyme
MKPVYPLLALARLRMGIDGKGVTTLVAGAGCPLQCQWCINKRLLREGMPTLVSPEQLLDRVRIDDLYFRATGGGITFGGGEPLLHADFLYEFCSSAPSGWTICVETSLHVPQRNVQIVADIADEFIVDCKDMNPQIYRKYTGGNEKLMESNLKFLLQTVGAGHIHVRVPHIPGYNTEADQANSAKRLKAIGFQDPELFTYTVRD